MLSHLDPTSLIKLYGKRKLLWHTEGNPKQARESHLAHSGSQSQCRIWFTFPAHGAIKYCYLLKAFMTSHKVSFFCVSIF